MIRPNSGSEHLEVDVDLHPTGNRFAVECGRFESILADGFNCLWFEAFPSGPIFWAGVRDDCGFDDFEVAGMPLSIDDELDGDIAGHFALSCSFGELGLDCVDHCGSFDTVGDGEVIDAVFVGIGLICRTWLRSGVVGQLP